MASVSNQIYRLCVQISALGAAQSKSASYGGVAREHARYRSISGGGKGISLAKRSVAALKRKRKTARHRIGMVRRSSVIISAHDLNEGMALAQ